MKQRVITSIFIACAYAVFILCGILIPREFGGHFFYDALIIAMMIIAGFEMSKAIGDKIGKTITILVVVNIVLGYVAFIISQETNLLGKVDRGGITAFFGQMFLIFIICIIYNMISKKTELKNVISTIFVIVYPVSLMVYMLAINYLSNEFRVVAILLTFLVSSFTDILAYLVGRSVGGPKLAPAISPKKTISGSIGGLMGGLISAYLVFVLGYYNLLNVQLFGNGVAEQVAHLTLIGIGGSVLNQLGDLIASYIKRVVGMKDFSSLLPGHGGILDRVDGMMLVAIFVYCYITVYSVFQVII